MSSARSWFAWTRTNEAVRLAASADRCSLLKEEVWAQNSWKYSWRADNRMTWAASFPGGYFIIFFFQ